MNEPFTMILYINGSAPNAGLTLTAETQAERDQIARIMKEATAAKAVVETMSYDPPGTLRFPLQAKNPARG